MIRREFKTHKNWSLKDKENIIARVAGLFDDYWDGNVDIDTAVTESIKNLNKIK